MTDKHNEGPEHLYHIAEREAAGAIEALAEQVIVDDKTMQQAFAAIFMTGIEVALRCARARPDRVPAFLDWMDAEFMSSGVDSAYLEQREAAFVDERPYLFGEEERL